MRPLLSPRALPIVVSLLCAAAAAIPVPLLDVPAGIALVFALPGAALAAHLRFEGIERLTVVLVGSVGAAIATMLLLNLLGVRLDRPPIALVLGVAAAVGFATAGASWAPSIPWRRHLSVANIIAVAIAVALIEEAFSLGLSALRPPVDAVGFTGLAVDASDGTPRLVVQSDELAPRRYRLITIIKGHGSEVSFTLPPGGRRVITVQLPPETRSYAQVDAYLYGVPKLAGGARHVRFDLVRPR